MNRKIGRILIVLMAALAFQATVRAQTSPASLFEDAAKAYQSSQYLKAREIYESMLTERRGDAALYYNLGNTYFRLGDRGHAILWYERASMLEPHDNDIQYNLSLAKADIKGAEEDIWDKILAYPEAHGLLWISTVLLWMWTGTLSLTWIRPRLSSRRFKRGIAISFALWIVAAGWGNWRLWNESRPWSIIVAPEAQIKSGPSDDFPVGATAPAGLRVLVLEERDGWTLVGLTNAGIKGWVPKGTVERLEMF